MTVWKENEKKCRGLRSVWGNVAFPVFETIRHPKHTVAVAFFFLFTRS